MYHDVKPPNRWPYILIALFFVALLPNLWLPELGSKEAINALMARDLREGTFIFTTLMGKQTLHPPLASWLIAVLSLVLPIGEFTVRLVDLLSLLGLAMLCAMVVKQAIGRRAAAVTAAAVFSSFAAMDTATRGEGNLLFCLLINMAWYTWYRLSREHRRWLPAWFFAHLLVCMAILAGGFQAIFYFYFPLVFLRRPINVLRRLRQSDHLLSMVLFLLVIVAWFVMIPNLGDQLIAFLANLEATKAPASYLKRLVLFPLRALAGYLPWVFLAWPAFCLAFRPLEKDPILAQFLRTITWSLFWVFWILPDAKPTALLPLIGPLSILIGVNYDILVRRHGETLLQIGRAISYFTIGIATVAIMFGLYLLNDPHTSRLTPLVAATSMAFLVVAIVGAFLLIRHRRQFPIWLTTAGAVVVLHMTYASTYKVRDFMVHSDRRELGATLQSFIPPGQTTYELSVGSFPSVCFYLQRPVIQVSSARELPSGPEVIYVLSDNEIPITGDRDWSAVTHPIKHDDYVLRVWKGTQR